jgi:hypothetical protein
MIEITMLCHETTRTHEVKGDARTARVRENERELAGIY